MNLTRIEPLYLNDKYLWKYLDIHKFLYFLYEKKIYFARLDRLEDPNEGLPHSIIREIYECELFPDEKHLNPHLFPDKKAALKQNRVNIKNLKDESDKIQKIQYVNCWFAGEREAYSMWSIYSNPDSVVLRFNSDELLKAVDKSLQKTSGNSWIEIVVCGFVQYQKVYPPEYDYAKYIAPTNKYSALKKDLSYSAENEFRFIVISKKIHEKKTKFEIKVEDFHNLDFHIITHPKMEDWMYNNIKNTLQPFGLEKKLIKSEIKLRSRL